MSLNQCVSKGDTESCLRCLKRCSGFLLERPKRKRLSRNETPENKGSCTGIGGPERIRTAVHGFAIRWIASLPPGLNTGRGI